MKSNQKLSKEMKIYIDYMIQVVNGSTNDWLRIRKVLISMLPFQYRSLFSRRDNSTRKIVLNEFDYEVMKYWKHKTKSNHDFYIDYSKTHPTNHIRKTIQ
jgi:hypothetical protein